MGAPYSLQRTAQMDQMMDAHRWLIAHGFRSRIPQRCPRQEFGDIDLAVGTEEWRAWILSRQTGTTFSESIRSYGPATENVRENLRRARAIRRLRYEERALQHMEDLLLFSRGQNPPTDLDMLLYVASSSPGLERTTKNVGVVMLKCHECQKLGLIK